MLNEALYSCLVELGVSEDRARAAACENGRLSELRTMIYELTRQSADTNDRVIALEKTVSNLDTKADLNFNSLEIKIDMVLAAIKSSNK